MKYLYASLRSLICVFALLCNIVTVVAQNQLEEANAHYAAGDYQEAAALYAELLAPTDEQHLNRTSQALVLYNLGNAQFKMGELAQAILSYERSLRLNPRDKDTQYNLEFARTQIIDNIEDNQAFFFSSWMAWLRNQLSEMTWRWISIISFVLMLAAMLSFLFGRNSGIRKASFHLCWILLLICTLTGINARSLHIRDTDRTEAIITQGILNAKSSPDASGTDLFTLHEGTKVEIRETIGQWSNIRVGNNQGWIQTIHMERI